MVKIHPESIQKGDEMYYSMRSVVCGLFFCVCICIGLVIMLVLAIEKKIKMMIPISFKNI